METPQGRNVLALDELAARIDVLKERLASRPAPQPAPATTKPIVFDRMLTTAQVAAALAVSEETLKKWRQRGLGPSYLNGAIRYPMSVIEKFIADSTVNT